MATLPKLQASSLELLNTNNRALLRKVKRTKAEEKLSKALILDLEIWGRGKEYEVVEVALIQVAYDSVSGGLGKRLDRYPGLRDPGPRANPKATGRFSKVKPEIVAGKKLNAKKIEALIAQSQIIIAHHIASDRPRFEARFPSSKSLKWLCSYKGVNWRITRANLEHLCKHFGVVNRDPHRAMPDAEALLNVLAQKDGAVSYFARLVGPTLKESD
jgi:DNA polymerase-3 subunit epsilon